MEIYLIGLFLMIVVGALCWFWGFCCGDKFATNHFSWSQGWDDCRNAIKEGLSEEAKALVDAYTDNADYPTCFGKPSTPNGDAENGCDNCGFVCRCHIARSFVRKENEQ